MPRKSNKEQEELYCICKKKYVEGEFMIECGKCNGWFHGSCVGIEEYQASDVDIYHCPECQNQHGPLILKKRRNVSRHNYKEIHDGTKQISAGTVMFVRQLKARKFPDGKEISIELRDGTLLTPNYLHENGFKKPIVVLNKKKLDMTVPPYNFTIYDVEQKVGSMYDLHVIDVSRQEDLRMKMREFTEYYNSPVRGKVLNVISLEFSNTSLSDHVTAPKIVRDISWVDNCWPEKPSEDSPHTKPVVGKYCLMSVKDCYTDFHVDFGGTSVWYHIVRGEKVFYLIEPTDENLKRFSQWVSSSDQGQVFFGEKVEKCYKLNVSQGSTLFIPTGWIHAVLTPKDSLVFGGNFLHSYNIPLHQKIYKLEKNLKTPLKFLFPNYETTNWYAARSILKKMKDIHAAGFQLPLFLKKGVQELIAALKHWTAKKDEYVKFHKLQVPIEINPMKLVKNLEKELKADAKISKQQTFPLGELPCPGSYSDASTKTILKLKLPTRANESSSPDQRNKRNKKAVSFKDSENDDSDSEFNEKPIKNNRVKNNKKMSAVKEEEDTMTTTKLKLKLSLPPSQLSDSEILKTEDVETEIMAEEFNLNHLITPPEKPLDLKAEIEAAKKDLFTDNINSDKKNGLYFSTLQTKEDCTFKPITFNPSKNFPTKPKSEVNHDDSAEVNEGYVIDTLPKPNANDRKVNKRQSDDDSDYDPSDDAYYQDAEFVYPRIDVTSELAEDDYSWKPGQRRKLTKSIGQKRRKSSSFSQDEFLNESGTLDPFFAPDSDDDNRLEISKPKLDNITIGKDTSKSSIATKPFKEKPKKGLATAKQRLGKLLKLDKTGTRYLRK